MDTIYSFGRWMQLRRKAIGLTQRELAERAHCSTVTIKKIEADQRRPSVQLADLLARSLAVPHDQHEVFIECARGRRPVDHLGGGDGDRIQESKAAHVPGIATSPLPEVSSPLIGRKTELEMLRRLLVETWLVTIAGVGGTGKTRLALAIANEWYRAGRPTAFVSLASISPDDNLAAAILESLGLQLLTDIDPTSQLLAYLGPRRLLLVLDNFEHLLASAGLLLQLHQAAPELTLLITSRERLRLPGEQLLPLHGLDYPRDWRQGSDAAGSAEISQYPAVQLFLNEAQRLMPGFVPVDDDALLELCYITDGLPLALELAASWVETLTLPDLVRKLSENLDLLVKDEPHRPIRHHSIHAAFDTTWQFLGDAEREAFVRLSVFRGGFTRQAAETIAGLSLSTLSNLVGRYLVQLDRTNGRYTLHELLRQYAAEKLAAKPVLEDQAFQEHAAFFSEFLADREDNLKGANQIEVLAEIRAERKNLWAACMWAALHPEEAPLSEAIAPLGIVCWLNNWVEDGYNLFTQAVRALSTYRDRLDVRLSLLHLQVWRVRFATWLGRPSDALIADVRQLLMEIRPSPELRSVLALYHLAVEEAMRDIGEREAARSHAEQALSLYEGLDDEWGQANALAQLGTVCWNVGAYDEALQHFEESLALRRQLGDRRGVAYSLDRLGLLLMHRGEMELSCRYLEQAIDLFGQLGDRSGLADAMENLASGWLELGRLDNAHKQYAAAGALYEELGLRHIGYTVLKALTAYASAHLGNYQRAADEAEVAVSLSRELGHKRSEGLALIVLGMASVAMGNDATAAEDLASGTSHLRDIGQLDELAQGIGVQALVSYRQGDPESARRQVLSALAIVSELRGLLASPDYALAVWALMLADRGEHERAAKVYRLVLAEPFGAASLWFEALYGRFLSRSPSSSFMPPDERWVAIEQLYQSLK